MIEVTENPVGVFLIIMGVILITPILSERVRLPGIVGIILGGMLVGPHGFNLLELGSEINLLATVGLIYLMFSAGLEVDIHQFTRVRNKALVFGLLTYMIPQIMGTLLGRWLGMNWPGAVLLGSAFSSHTLIAFPILTRLGVVRNEAVSITIGATVMTDITAFIVLAVVTGIHEGNVSIPYFLILFGLLVVLTAVILLVLPRIGKSFFSRYHSRTVEFQFVLVVLFIAALMTEQAGLHYVVGAFLAGLAINVTLPHHSAVTGHVLFIGESFFIPIFLMFSGMMTDPMAFFGGGSSLLVAAGVTLVAYVSKWLASWLIARNFHYTRNEQYTAFGLSHAQAAVTVPTLLIGMQAGLFSETVFNGAILMILLTSITSPLMVARFAPRLRIQEAEEPAPLFSRVLVPIANPETQEHLITLASILARECHGRVLALHVAQRTSGQNGGLEHQRRLLEQVPKILDDPEADVHLLARVDTSVVNGILHAAVENGATAIVMGWRGRANLSQNVLGSMLDEVVWRAPFPVLVGRLTVPMNGVARVVLAFPPGHLNPVAITGSLQIVRVMCEALNVPLLMMGDASLQAAMTGHPALHGFLQPLEILPIHRRIVQEVQKNARPNDLIVIPMLGRRKRFLSPLGDIPEHLAAVTHGSILVVHHPL